MQGMAFLTVHSTLPGAFFGLWPKKQAFTANLFSGIRRKKGFFVQSFALAAAFAVFAPVLPGAARLSAQEAGTRTAARAAPAGNFARGEAFFMQNDPQAALPLLEAALAEDPANMKTYEYLGIVYLQLDRPDDAAAVYTRALARGGGARPAFNLGNIRFAQGNWEEAIRYYGEALAADQAYAPAWLNRANARVRAGTLLEAVEDYQRYLVLEPRSPQRARIEELAAFINGEIAAAERRRVAEEERARAEAEQIRQAEEQRRIAAAERARVEAEERRQAEERRRQLLEEVSASLQASAGETQGLSAGSESVQGYDGEFELE